MNSAIDLALASTYLYLGSPKNRTSLPAGGALAQLPNGNLAYMQDTGYGFSAGAFIDNNNHLVIVTRQQLEETWPIRYNRFSTLANISFRPGQSILGNTGFVTSSQTLQSTGSLQDLTPRLS